MHTWLNASYFVNTCPPSRTFLLSTHVHTQVCEYKHANDIGSQFRPNKSCHHTARHMQTCGPGRLLCFKGSLFCPEPRMHAKTQQCVCRLPRCKPGRLLCQGLFVWSAFIRQKEKKCKPLHHSRKTWTHMDGRNTACNAQQKVQKQSLQNSLLEVVAVCIAESHAPPLHGAYKTTEEA